MRETEPLGVTRKASQTPDVLMPEDHIVAIFAAWPAPIPPQYTIRLPIVCKIGSARVKASEVPPTMNVNVPATAPPTPPETGASSVKIIFADEILVRLLRASDNRQ